MKNIIFDFDGTIANTFDISVPILHKLQKKAGLNFTQKELISLIREKTTQELADTFEINKLKFFLLIIKMRIELRKKMNQIEIYSKLDMVIKDLSKSHNLYLVTSNSRSLVLNFLRKHNLERFKAYLFKAPLLYKEKGIQKLIEKAKLNKQETLYIGDEVRDFNACKKIDLNYICVSWGYNSKDLLEKNGVKNIATTTKELKELVKKQDTNKQKKRIEKIF